MKGRFSLLVTISALLIFIVGPLAQEQLERVFSHLN